jgi:hypothetical protein
MHHYKHTIPYFLLMAVSCVVRQVKAFPTMLEVDQSDGCIVLTQFAGRMDGDNWLVVFLEAQAICDYKASSGNIRPPIVPATPPSNFDLRAMAYGGFTPDTNAETLTPTTNMMLVHYLDEQSEFWFSRGRVYNLSSLAMNPTTEEETMIRPVSGLTL